MPHVRPVDGEGRLPLPSEVREELGIEAGSEVTVFLEDGELRVVPGDQTTVHDLQRRDHGSPARTGVSKGGPPEGDGGESMDAGDSNED